MSFFFKKQSKEGKIRLENQLTDAKINPSSTIDISDCDLTQIPQGFFALCQVLRKEVILLHDNRLHDLNEKGGADEVYKLAQFVRIIDAHNNKLEKLHLGKFTTLQVLILEKNRLSALPDELFQLSSLQTLNLKDNHLSFLPDLFYGLKSLRSLDISGNNVTNLPLSLARLKCAETIILDARQMHYPPSAICEQGTCAIMNFLCTQAGVEYVPPSAVVLSLLNNPNEDSMDRSRTSCRSSDVGLYDSYSKQASAYQKKKEEKLLEQARLQRTLLEAQSQQASLVANSNKSREELIKKIAFDQDEIDSKVLSATSEREKDRLRLLNAINQIEDQSQNLVNEILALNKNVKWAERQLEEEENRRLAENEFLKIRYEEYDRAKKEEIAKTMSEIMAQNMSLEDLRLINEQSKDNAANRILQMERDHTDNLDTVLKRKDGEVCLLLEELQNNEQFHKKALLSLMESRDARSNRLNSQIDLIQHQLAQLSRVEMKNKDFKIETEQMCLEEQRMKLTQLLMQLNDEKERRNRELKNRLIDLEQAKEAEHMDFWLVQFQRMLENKPVNLIERENELEMEIRKLLIEAGAQNYIASFSRHRITTENLPFLNEEDLQRLGIYQVGLRKSVLNAIENYLSRVKLGGGGKGKKGVEEEPPLPPSAPSMSKLSADEEEKKQIANAVYEAECVVCMEEKCEIILIPCGHVCMCGKCSVKIDRCPMCREQSTLKMRLTEHPNLL